MNNTNTDCLTTRFRSSTFLHFVLIFLSGFPCSLHSFESFSTTTFLSKPFGGRTRSQNVAGISISVFPRASEALLTLRSVQQVHEEESTADVDDDADEPPPQQSSIVDSSSSSTNEYSFFDEAIIIVRSGSGGAGASTYKKGVRGQDGPPDGGNGGRGGNIVLIVDPSLNTLAGLNNAWRPNSFGGSGAAVSGTMENRPKFFRAENGEPGERQSKRGRYGKDVEIRLPPGTLVQEEITFDTPDGITQSKLIDVGSLTEENPKLVVAKGGEGGEGSGVVAKNRGVRRPRIPQEGGQKKTIKLTLKIVADVALVAVPNAGKSTFLAAVTRAKPKIANYPFTTVIPNLGVWIPPEAQFRNDKGSKINDGAGSDGLVLCDVPGLIEGAARGVGLGHAFLRHVERCHVILHLVDATAEDPVKNFRMINSEIVKYGTGQLAKMPQVVVVNKIDAIEAALIAKKENANNNDDVSISVENFRKDLENKLREEMSHTRLMWMSALEKDGVDDLMIRLDAFVKKVKEATNQ